MSDFFRKHVTYKSSIWIVLWVLHAYVCLECIVMWYAGNMSVVAEK